VARSTRTCCSALVALFGATYAADAQAATLVPCAELEAKTMTLRGTLSTVIDNAPPTDDRGGLTLDPSQRIFVLRLKSPLCSGDLHSTDRVVTQLKVLTVEVVPSNGLARSTLQSRLGKVIRIHGTLSKNPWWRYRSPLLLTASEIR